MIFTDYFPASLRISIIIFFLSCNIGLMAQDSLQRIVVLKETHSLTKRHSHEDSYVFRKTESNLFITLQGAAKGYIKLQDPKFPNSVWQRTDIDSLMVSFELEAIRVIESDNFIDYIIASKKGTFLFKGNAISVDFDSRSEWSFDIKHQYDIQLEGGTLRYSKSENEIKHINFPLISSSNSQYPRAYNIEYFSDTIRVRVLFPPDQGWWFVDPYDIFDIPHVSIDIKNPPPPPPPPPPEVTDPPVPSFVYFPDYPTEKSQIHFNASSTFNPSDQPLKYHWDFGDGNTAEDIIVIHTFSEAKEYHVTLTIVDGNSGKEKSFSRILDLTGKKQAIVSHIKDLKLVEGTITSPPLQWAKVDLFWNNSLIQTTFTSLLGKFRFDDVIEGQSYKLKISGNRSLPELQNVEVIKVIENIIPSEFASEINLPLSLSLQKHSLINQLEHLTTKFEYYSPTVDWIPLSISYNEEFTKSLLEEWLSDVGKNPDSITESLARFLITEQVLDSLYANASTMTHETSKALFEINKSFVTIILLQFQIFNSVINNITNSALHIKMASKVLKIKAIRQRLLTEFFFTTLTYMVGSAVPEDYRTGLNQALSLAKYSVLSLKYESDYDVFEKILDEIVKSVFVSSMDNIWLSQYVVRTQPSLDAAVVKANNFDYTSDVLSAYQAVQSLIRDTNEATDIVKAKTDSLQFVAEIFDNIFNATYFNNTGFLGLSALLPLSILIKQFSIAHYGTAAILSAWALEQITKNSQIGVARAFDPNASSSRKNNLVTTTSKNSRYQIKYSSAQQTQYYNSLLEASNAYLNKLHEIIDLANKGLHDDAIGNLDNLLRLDEELSGAIYVAQAPIYSAADQAYQKIPDFEEKYSVLNNAINKTISERMILYAQLVRYSLDQSYTIDSLEMQADSVAWALKAISNITTETTDLVSDIAVSPLVMIKVHKAQTDNANPDNTLLVEATIKNVGSSPADSITVILVPDSLAKMLTKATFEIPRLNSNEEKILSWKFQVDSASQRIGNYLIEVASANAKTLSANGIYTITQPPLPVGITSKDLDSNAGFQLKQNFPNPIVKGYTTFEYILPKPCWVILQILDGSGKIIATLVNDKLLPGKYQTIWDARQYANGHYYCSIQAGNFRDTKKIILTK